MSRGQPELHGELGVVGDVEHHHLPLGADVEPVLERGHPDLVEAPIGHLDLSRLDTHASPGEVYLHTERSTGVAGQPESCLEG